MRLECTLRRIAKCIEISHYIVTATLSLLDLALYVVTIIYVRRALYQVVFMFHLAVRGVPRDLRGSLVLRYKRYLGNNLSLVGVLKYLSRTSQE